jgi:hypothetical protein
MIKTGTAYALRKTLLRQVSFITGIDMSAFKATNSDWQAFFSFSIAQKISWAAKWRTTQEEDVTYSLLGIFRVKHAVAVR